MIFRCLRAIVFSASICIFAVILSGCSNKFVTPAGIPQWLVIRQINGMEKDYNMSADEAERRISSAIAADGGHVRYVTAVGNSRTMYGRTRENETITVDIDPYRNNPNMVKVDINVSLYGDVDQTKKLYNRIDATPTGK